MKIYVVMIRDRHTDPEAFLFSTYEKATAFAQNYLEGCDNWAYYHNNEATPDGWLFFIRYSGEGDCIWILEKELT